MIRVTTLGESQVKLRHVRLSPGSGLNFSVGLYLAIEAGRRLARTKLRALFWPGASELVARHALRQLLYMIRRAGGQVICDREFVRLAADTVTVDFMELAPDPTADPSLLLQEFLPEYDPRISADHEKWIQALRDKGHARLRDTLLKAIAQYRQLGRWIDVEVAARRCLELDPLNEEATLCLAEAMAMAGRKLAAVQILERYREDLGSQAPVLQLPADVLQRRVSELLPALLPSSKDVAFVGRTHLLAELGARTKLLAVAQGGSYHVYGPRGIGKSRLIAEVARTASLNGTRVIRLTCTRHVAQAPGMLLRQLTVELLQLPGALGCAPSSLNRMRGLVESRPVGADIGEFDWPMTDSISAALIELADAVSHEQALLIVLEDLERIDRLSEKLLKGLRGVLRDRPILVISSGLEAPTVTHQLDENTTSIELKELSPVDSVKVLKGFGLSGNTRMNDEFVARCVALADGNPGLLVDLGCRWAAEGTSFQFPQSVKDAVNDRFAQLSDEGRLLLQLCAVFGSECTVERVLRTELYNRGTLLSAVDQLGRLNLVRLESASFIVADPLISSQLLCSTSDTALRYLHHLAALALEAELDIPEYRVLVWHCARQHNDAGNPARALELLTACADRLLLESKLSEAISTLRRARAFCSTPKESLQINQRLVRALRLAEHWQHVLQAAQLDSQYRRDARIHSDEHSDVELASLSARWHMDQSTAAIVREANRCLFDEARPPEHRGEAAVRLLIVAHNMGDRDGLRRTHTAAADLKARTGTSLPTLTAEMIYQSALGDLAAAQTAGDQLLGMARSTLAPPELALTLRQAAIPLRLVGRFEEARALLSEALDITTALEIAYGSLKATDMIGTTFLEEGRLAEAWNWYLKSVRWIGGIGDPQSSTYSRNLGAKLALLQHKKSAGARLSQMRLSKILKQPVIRLRCDELALWIGLSMEKGATRFTSSVIRAFEQDFARLKSLGNQDFAAYVMVRLKESTSGTVAAASFLDEYVKNDRREKTDVPGFLMDLKHCLSKSERLAVG